MGVKSADRVLALFELFDRVQRPMMLKEIVQTTGYPQSSVAALLTTLIEAGYIRHDLRRHEYMPTPQITQLGKWIPDTGIINEPGITLLMQQLHSTTGETVVIGAEEGMHVRYLNVLLAKRPIMFHVQTGVLRPLCSSAIGWALLSLKNDDEIRKVVEQANRQKEQVTRRISLRSVRQHVGEIRKFGFAVSRHAVHPGVGMVAMPLGAPVRGQQVALGVGGPVDRLDNKLSRIVRELRNGIGEWSKSLAAIGPDQTL
jgi:IclR family KDG regulon transcriptional repressor